MSNPIIKVKRATSEAGRFAISTGAPSTLNHGEVAVIFPDDASATPSSLGETIYVGAVDGSAIAVGGSGTFATRQYVDDKVTSVFVYKGKITSFFPAAEATFPLNLDSTLSQVTGSYYSIDSDYPGNPENDDPGVVGTDKNAVAISWTEGSDSKTLLVKKGDSIVKTATGWEKFDNVDAVVHGVATETVVTGDENTGYTVGIAAEFKNRVSDLEDKTQNIDLANTSSELTTLKGKVVIDQGTLAEPELVVKDVYGDEVISAKGAAISLGAAGNPGTEVKIARKLVMQDSTATTNTWEFKSDGSAKNYAMQGAALGASFEVEASGNVTLGTPYGGEVKVQSDFKAVGAANLTNFSVTKGGLIKLNEATNSATVESYGTLDINAGGGLSDGGWVGIKSSGHLVANGANLEIRGFVIDGGEF